ncbi:hypothetical protein [Syntrophotalea acetylenica]|uniref:hypothetical protein n=1 Tax=Syntrophotalea acetylenica TaxID=29542 RepID=UPI0011AB3F10|nr:hypothetical protein [Syntrophotalea acetylenica]
MKTFFHVGRLAAPVIPDPHPFQRATACRKGKYPDLPRQVATHWLFNESAPTKKTRTNTGSFSGINAGFVESARGRGRNERLIISCISGQYLILSTQANLK